MFWHTQGGGKSYSMAFFAAKVRRKVPGNFTFLLMTDRHDLDDQIYKTFAGSGIASKETPRAGSGHDLERVGWSYVLLLALSRRRALGQ